GPHPRPRRRASDRAVGRTDRSPGPRQRNRGRGRADNTRAHRRHRRSGRAPSRTAVRRGRNRHGTVDRSAASPMSNRPSAPRRPHPIGSAGRGPLRRWTRMRLLLRDTRQMWELLEIPRWRLAVAVGWGVLALGSGLGLAALAAWLIARAWQMPPVLDLTVAVVAVRALGISRGLCRYLERLATHDVALRSMAAASASVYRALASAPLWLTRRSETGFPGAAQTPAPAGTSGRSLPTAPRMPGRLRRGDVLVRVG